MIAKVIGELALNSSNEIKAVIELLGRAVQDQPYCDLVQEVFEISPSFEERKLRLKNGHFSGLEFVRLVDACGDGKNTNIQILTPFLQRLNEWGLIGDNNLFQSDADVRFPPGPRPFDGLS